MNKKEINKGINVRINECTNKKEYIEWIVTAKRSATRNERLNGTLERLSKQWKNPRNL